MTLKYDHTKCTDCDECEKHWPGIRRCSYLFGEAGDKWCEAADKVLRAAVASCKTGALEVVE